MTTVQCTRLARSMTASVQLQDERVELGAHAEEDLADDVQESE